MNPLHRVRKQILQITQAEMAAITQTRQATVSRWEQGELEPSRDQLALILEFAHSNGIDLTPDDFFDLDQSPDKSPSTLQSGPTP